jgi:glycosyltransferase involved in cell wall biosynthesis
LKILICYEYFSPAKKSGGISRSLLNLSVLLSKTNEVYVFTGDKDMGENQQLPVEINKWLWFSQNIQVFYANNEFQNFSSVKKIMTEIQPEVVYLNGVFTPTFSLYPLIDRIISKKEIKYVIAPRGMLQTGALNQKSVKKSLYLKLIKLLGIFNNITWHVTDEQEGNDVAKFNFSEAKIEQVSNIPSLYHQKLVAPLKIMNTMKIVYLSLITEKKNLIFAIESLKNISSEQQVIFDIYGPIKEVSYWNKCTILIDSLPSNIAVTYKGAVIPKDTQTILAQYHLFYLPTKGENFGHAIFESLSVGTPVLLSDKTPWRNLEAVKAGWDLSLESPSQFTEVIVSLAKLYDGEYVMFREGAITVANDFIANSDFEQQYKTLFKL